MSKSGTRFEHLHYHLIYRILQNNGNLLSDLDISLSPQNHWMCSFSFISLLNFYFCYILSFQTFLIKPCVFHKFQNQFYSSVNHLDALALKEIPLPSNCGITCHNFALPFCFVFWHVLWMSKECKHFQCNSKEFWYLVLGTWK